MLIDSDSRLREDFIKHLIVALIDVEAVRAVIVATKLKRGEVLTSIFQRVEHQLMHHTEERSVIAHAIDGVLRPHPDVHIQTVIPDQEVDEDGAWIVLRHRVQVVAVEDHQSRAPRAGIPGQRLNNPVEVALLCPARLLVEKVVAIIRVDRAVVIDQILPHRSAACDRLVKPIADQVPQKLLLDVIHLQLAMIEAHKARPWRKHVAHIAQLNDFQTASRDPLTLMLEFA